MDIELIKVNNNNHETFENIYEFYLYEISRYYNYDVEENGKFSNDMPKYRSGFFTYNVIRKYFLEKNKITKFYIINNNKRWLECMEYMINKNNDICKIIEKKEITFHKSKNQKYEFTSFLVKPV